jgi:sulfide:quinone oxidoreductase
MLRHLTTSGQSSGSRSRAAMAGAEDWIATDRWANEGGRLLVEDGERRPRVVIAGGGVAGLETLLALRALLGDRIDVTIVAPEVRFVNQSMAVDRPAKPRVRGLKLKDVAVDLDARWLRGAVGRVEPSRHFVVTEDGRSVAYDRLVVALGARPSREWNSRGVLTYHGGRDNAEFRLLLRQILARKIRKVAFVKPSGPSWPVPLYELAVATAEECAAHAADADLSFITPESEPLEIFGLRASKAMRTLLDAHDVTLLTSSYGVPSRPGRLHISPGRRRMDVDRIVTLPRLAGPVLRGLPVGRDGFIPADGHGRVPGVDDVYAAGDATEFPIKQGGLAAQQADAVAEAVAASLGADISPEPFTPVLRGLLLAGGSARYLRADISAGGSDSTVSDKALWWPPNRLCGRYLAPYLSRQVGFAADVMPRDEQAVPVAIELKPPLPDAQRRFAELTDLDSS